MTLPAQENKDSATVAAFSNQWARLESLKRDPAEVKALFDRFFCIFPWDRITPDAVGFEMGCGSGRFAQFVAPRVRRLICVDAAPDAIRVAQKKLATFTNIQFLNQSVGHVTIEDASMDFGYSYGVLHHVPDTQRAISDCVKLLRPGAPFLIYLYYAFDNRPRWFQIIWRLSEVLRLTISRLPMGLRNTASDIAAALIYWPLARICLGFEKIGLNISHFPLADFKCASFARMRSNARDRFGTPLEQRFTRAEIKTMLENAGLSDIRFSENLPYWCAIGIKS